MIKELMLYLRVAERNFSFYQKESITLIYNAVLHSLVKAEEVSIYSVWFFDYINYPKAAVYYFPKLNSPPPHPFSRSRLNWQQKPSEL